MIFAIAALLCWAIGAVVAWKERRQSAVYVATLAGLAILFTFTLGIWISLERPPTCTMSETRLWYPFFLPLAGITTYSRWRYRWILSFSFVLSLVFICINLFKPEIHNKTLMSALQGPWFTPHVIVYMFAYAMSGATTVMVVYLPWTEKKATGGREMELCDNLVNVGLSFMTLGMLFEALWVKEAQEHYWGWDPRGTWATATWIGYLCYIRYWMNRRQKVRVALIGLLICFVLLQMCWYDISYLPSAQGTSIHTYNLN